MGALGNVPNFNAWLATAWGAGGEYWSAGWQRGVVLGFTFGQNPPYALNDFLGVYPAFFGAVTTLTGAVITANSAIITLTSTAGLAAGQLMAAGGYLPNNALIKSVDSATQVTLSQEATASGSAVPLQVYTQPLLPVFVLQLYVNLAYASLVYERWQEQWYLAMAWFVAHYATLYLKSSAEELASIVQASMHGEVPTGAVPGTAFTLSSTPPTGVLQGLYVNGLYQTPGVDYALVGTQITLTTTLNDTDKLYATWPVQQAVNTVVQLTAAQVAARGIADGILTSKSVGDVSASYQVLTALEAWGAWNLTWFGVQLATMAKVIGSGPALVW